MRASSQGPASAAALRWLEGAFAGLRAELDDVRGRLDQQQAAMAEMVGGVSEQQLMLAELIDARDDDFRLIEFAEALPQLVSDAVAAAVRDDRQRIVTEIVAAVEDNAPDAGGPAAGSDPAARAAELRAFLQNDPSTRSIVAAVATQAASRAMKAEVAEQLPAVLDEARADADARMSDLSERLERLVAEAVRAGRAAEVPAAPKPARTTTTRAATPKTAAAKKVSAAKKSPAAKKVPAEKSVRATKAKVAAPRAKATRTSRTAPTKSPPTRATPSRSTAKKKAAAGTPVRKSSSPGSVRRREVSGRAELGAYKVP